MRSENITYKKLKKLKSKKDKKVVFLMILVLVLVLLLGIIYLTTDLFKSPKTLFHKYLFVGNLNNITDVSYDDLITALNEHTSFSAEGEIRHHIEDDSIIDASTINMADDIVTNYRLDMQAHDAYLNVKTSYKNNDIFNFEFVDNDAILGVKEKHVENRYTVIDLSKLKETLEKMGQDTTNVYNISKFHRCELYYISKEDRETIYNTYKKHVNAIILNNDYSVKRNVEIDVNGNKYKCNAYTLRIKEEQLKNIYLRILNELKEDELTLKLIVEKYNMINWYNRDITKEDIIKDIQIRIDEISSQGPGLDELEITVYENNSKTIRTEIKRDTNTICLDVTRNKNDKLMLLKVDVDELNFEILLNLEKINENESVGKFIYTRDTTKFMLDFTNETHRNVNVNIPHFNDENSIILSKMSEEELEDEHTLEEIRDHFIDRLEIVGIPRGVLRKFIFDTIGITDIIDENMNN